MRAPSGLGARGKALWRQVLGHAGGELRPERLHVLGLACATADVVERMQVLVDEAGSVTVPGSRGQQVVHPLLPELRAHRVELARLLGQIGLRDDGGQGAAADLSEQMRRAARVRWDRHRRR